MAHSLLYPNALLAACFNICPLTVVPYVLHVHEYDCLGCLSAQSCCVFLSRVHPCESNSSWSMRGLVFTALQDSAQCDEKQHPLVILPMLNVDGTVHGWYVLNLLLTHFLQKLEVVKGSRKGLLLFLCGNCS